MLAQVLDGVLVERNGVSKSAAGGIFSAGEKTVFRGVPARDGGMREAGEDGEVIPERFEILEQRRKGVVAAGLLREKRGGQDAEVIGDQQHPIGCGLFLPCMSVLQERRQRQANAKAAQEVAAGDG